MNIQSKEANVAKNMVLLDKATKMCEELNASKRKLEVAHATLSKDFELHKAHKSIKGELIKLRGS